MARHRITGRALAKALNRNESGITKLKAAETMPRLTGDSLNKLLDGLNALKQTNTEHVITPSDLIDYIPGSLEDKEGAA